MFSNFPAVFICYFISFEHSRIIIPESAELVNGQYQKRNILIHSSFALFTVRILRLYVLNRMFEKKMTGFTSESYSIVPDEWLAVHGGTSAATGANSHITADARLGGAC